MFKRKLLNKTFYSIIAVALFMPVSSVSAISCIEPIRYGNLQVDVLPPISNPECRVMTLNVQVEQSENLSDTQIQLQLHDKAQKIIPHSSFLIAIKNQNNTMLEELFHTHSGSLTMILKQNDSVNDWALDNGDEKLGIGWLNDNGKYIINVSLVKQSEPYEIGVSVFNVYDDTFSFKPEERPKFTFPLSPDESGHIPKLNAELKQQNGYKPDEHVSIQSLSPIKQLKAGLEINQIVCKVGQVLTIKASDGLPACVKPETREKLLERGWAKLI